MARTTNKKRRAQYRAAVRYAKRRGEPVPNFDAFELQKQLENAEKKVVIKSRELKLNTTAEPVNLRQSNRLQPTRTYDCPPMSGYQIRTRTYDCPPMSGYQIRNLLAQLCLANRRKLVTEQISQEEQYDQSYPVMVLQAIIEKPRERLSRKAIRSFIITKGVDDDIKMTAQIHFALERLLASRILMEFRDDDGKWSETRFRVNDLVFEKFLQDNGLTELIDAMEKNDR